MGAESGIGTDQVCKLAGIYKSTCPCHKEIPLLMGETFPPCDLHGAVEWMLVRAL
ncbi:MAG TPA: hypothetical protein VKA48_05090 [Gammaproteobacteria bacterium]|nr:hypothetical protein [Gammaproteobacteria bacterium]